MSESQKNLQISSKQLKSPNFGSLLVAHQTLAITWTLKLSLTTGLIKTGNYHVEKSEYVSAFRAWNE